MKNPHQDSGMKKLKIKTRHCSSTNDIRAGGTNVLKKIAAKSRTDDAAKCGQCSVSTKNVNKRSIKLKAKAAKPRCARDRLRYISKPPNGLSDLYSM